MPPRGRGRGARVVAAAPAAPAGGSPAAVAAPPPGRAVTVEQRAAQKLRDGFSELSIEEIDGKVDPVSTLTLRARLEKDIRAREAGYQQKNKTKQI